MSPFSCYFPVLFGWEDPQNCNFFYIHCHNLNINFFSLYSNLFLRLFFVWIAYFHVSFKIFFLIILQIYLHAFLWCTSLVCAWRQMLNIIRVVIALSHYWGEKGHNVYIAPYWDRMWHDSCNIFGFLKTPETIFKMQPSKHVLHCRWKR